MTLKRRGRACDFFVGISGRNLICLIGVGPAEWGIAGAKFEQSCILERRKFIGVTPVSPTRRQSLIFAANIVQYQVHKRISIANSRNFSYTSFFSSQIHFFFFCSFRFLFFQFPLSSQRHHWPRRYDFLNVRTIGVFTVCFCNERN